MKIIFVILAGLLPAQTALASNIKCKVDFGTIQNIAEKKIPVSVVEPSQISNAKRTIFRGSRFAAIFYKSEKYDSQTVLKMQLDDITSTIQNVNESSVYELEKGNLRFQCWYEIGDWTR